jgi:hypothetical protein
MLEDCEHVAKDHICKVKNCGVSASTLHLVVETNGVGRNSADKQPSRVLPHDTPKFLKNGIDTNDMEPPALQQTLFYT